MFLAVLGASNYTYAEATWSQSLPDWIGSHVRAFVWFGGVTELLIPDNLKSGVDKSCRYEPVLNPTYHDLATHYQTTVLPARVRKPKDKAKAEAGVLLVERWILVRLRHHRFFSLDELNREIRRLLELLNNRPFQKLAGSRQSLCENIDRSALRPLPEAAYQFAEWKKAKVNIDYHIELTGHYYSVPHALVGKVVEIRYTNNTVACLFKGQRVASHPRFAEGQTQHRQGAYAGRGQRTTARSAPQYPGRRQLSTAGGTLMLIHPTIEKLESLRLTGMVMALKEQQNMDLEGLSFEERLGLLVDRETVERDSRRLKARLRQAKLRHQACIEDIDFKQPRGVDKSLTMRLAEGSWLQRHQNMIITGPTGAGKSYLACAFAQKACRSGYTASYQRMPRLFEEINLARGDGR